MTHLCSVPLRMTFTSSRGTPAAPAPASDADAEDCLLSPDAASLATARDSRHDSAALCVKTRSKPAVEKTRVTGEASEGNSAKDVAHATRHACSCPGTWGEAAGGVGDTWGINGGEKLELELWQGEGRASQYACAEAYPAVHRDGLERHDAVEHDAGLASACGDQGIAKQVHDDRSALALGLKLMVEKGRATGSKGVQKQG